MFRNGEKKLQFRDDLNEIYKKRVHFRHDLK